MNLRTQRRVAAAILDVGKKRIWFDPMRLDEIQEAITRQDISELIKNGIIKKIEVHGVRRRMGKRREERFAKGRRRGTAKRKKKIVDRKMEYVFKIRKLRSYLKMLKSEGKLDKTAYCRLRKLSKSGVFSDVNRLKEYIQINFKK